MTLGDPRGIGPEVVAKALAQSPLDAEITIIGPDEQVARIPADRRVGLGLWGSGKPEAGNVAAPLPDLAGRLAGRGVEQAVALALAGDVDAIVTGPVHKAALHLAGYHYPGVTEFLAHLTPGAEVAMMLVTGPLRVVLVTTHVSLRAVPDLVTVEAVVRTGRITRSALARWWGLPEPRLAVCALNPHAGEAGLFG
ncbi:MAG: PdxA family dehydrogenase, partial [Acidimicrobiales bacterium]